MGHPQWEVEYFEKQNGDCPVVDFLDHLPAKDRVYVTNAIDRLEEHGLALDRPHSGYLRDHILELRIRVRRVLYRVLYSRCGDNRFVLLLGIRKQSEKVRDSDIDKAIEYRNDYLARTRGVT